MEKTAINKLYLKKEKMFIPWNGNVLVYKTERTDRQLDLNKFDNMRLLLRHVKEHITVKCNTSFNAVQNQYRHMRIFNDFLQKTDRTVSSFEDIDKELVTSYISVLRDNPRLLSYIVSNCSSTFSSLKAFYKWGYNRGLSGTNFETFNFIARCKLPRMEVGVPIKTMDSKKGPYVHLEMLVLDKFFAGMLNNWDSINSQDKTSCILFLLNRETSRRFSELTDLEVTDLYRAEESSFVKLHVRKTVRWGELNKAHHVISDWIYDFAARYIEETKDLREELRTTKMFVWKSKGVGDKDWKPYMITGEQGSDYVDRLIKKAALPNRLFFRQTKMKQVEELKKPEHRKYRLNFTSSRGRDTFGSVNAAKGTPMELVAIRMGHASAITTMKYYVVLRPEMVSELLSETVGELYSQIATYFHNPVVAELTTDKKVFDAEDPHSLVFGGCLENYCNHHPRIACYNCTRFQPLSTAEHKRSLAWLMNKREQLIRVIDEAGGKKEGSHIKLILENVDKAMAVCKSIISQCTGNECESLEDSAA